MVNCAPGQGGQCSNDTTDDFDFGVRLGLVFVVESACLSALAVTGLLGYIGVRSESYYAQAIP